MITPEASSRQRFRFATQKTSYDYLTIVLKADAPELQKANLLIPVAYTIKIF
jgi:hypothetical protein